jgi:hypothetical protein
MRKARLLCSSRGKKAFGSDLFLGYVGPMIEGLEGPLDVKGCHRVGGRRPRIDLMNHTVEHSEDQSGRYLRKPIDRRLDRRNRPAISE